MFTLDYGVAKKAGLEAAAMFGDLEFYWSTIQDDWKLSKEGTYYVERNFKELEDTFYFLTKEQVRTGINNLVKAGFMLVKLYDDNNGFQYTLLE